MTLSKSRNPTSSLDNQCEIMKSIVSKGSIATLSKQFSQLRREKESEDQDQDSPRPLEEKLHACGVTSSSSLSIKVALPSNPLEQQSSNESKKDNSPLVTPSPSLVLSVESRDSSLCTIPLRGELKRHRSSETLLVNSIAKRSATSSESGETNATFQYVQRSGRDLVKRIVERLRDLIPETPNDVEQDKSLKEKRATEINEKFVVLYGYATDEYYRIILGRYGAIQVAVDALTVFPDVELVQASGILLLTSLCRRHSGNTMKIIETGGIRSIIEAMRSNSECKTICSMAINCLFELTNSFDLATLFLSKMHDAQDVIKSIDPNVLTCDTPQKRLKLLSILSALKVKV